MLVSVILPIYNASAFLKECIDSILAQTFTDFELLALDDGSTDDSANIVRGYDDERVKLIPCGHNFINTLNRGIAISQGEFLARMDADDIMHPQRLQLQVEVLQKDRRVDICSSWANTFGRSNSIIGAGCGFITRPLLSFLLGNFIIHPSTMIRKSFLGAHDLWYRQVPYAEDFDLWVEAAKAGGTFFIIQEPLLNYRVSNNQVTRNHFEEQEASRIDIQQRLLEHLIQRSVEHKTQIERLYHNMLEINGAEMIDADHIFTLFHQIFSNCKNAGIFL